MRLSEHGKHLDDILYPYPQKTAFYCVTKSREPTTNESDVFSVLACTLFVSVDNKLVSILPYHRKAKVFRAFAFDRV